MAAERLSRATLFSLPLFPSVPFRRRRKTSPAYVLVAAAICFLMYPAQTCLAQEPDRGSRRDPFAPLIVPGEQGTSEEAPASPDLSAEDVTEQLKEVKEARRGVIGEGVIGDVAAAWYRFSGPLKEVHGLDLGMAYTVLYQYAGSRGDPHEGASGDFDLFGTWRLIGKEGDNAGSLSFATEGRHALASHTPGQIGAGVGSSWSTADGYTIQEFSLTQLWWSQQLSGDRLRLRFGKLDQTTFIDNNRLKGSSVYFLNQAFAGNPTLPAPDSGLGFGVQYTAADRYAFTAGIGNANAVKTRIDADTLDEGEFFTAAEFRYSPKIEALGAGNYRFTFWHADEREKAGLPPGRGFSFSFDQEVGNGVILFLRGGAAGGGLATVRRMLSGGAGIEAPFGRKDDLLGVGLAWGDPEEAAWRDQYAGEVFYRLQLTAHSRLTPGYQLIIRPSSAPDDDRVSVYEVRFRIAF
jgi:porin